MTRRRFALGFAAAPWLRGEVSQQRGKELVAKVGDALGGDAFRNMQTRSELGRAYSFYRQQITGLAVARIYVKYLPPDAQIPKDGVRLVERQVFGKKLEDAVIFTKKWRGLRRDLSWCAAARRFPYQTVSRYHRAGYLLHSAAADG